MNQSQKGSRPLFLSNEEAVSHHKKHRFIDRVIHRVGSPPCGLSSWVALLSDSDRVVWGIIAKLKKLHDEVQVEGPPVGELWTTVPRRRP